jgi:hypothetical protein
MAHLFLETLAMPILLFSGGGRVCHVAARTRRQHCGRTSASPWQIAHLSATST